MGKAVPISSNALCNWMKAKGWTYEGGMGDHSIYRYAAGNNRKAHVPRGGHWSKEVPWIVLKNIALIMGITAVAIRDEVR